MKEGGALLKAGGVQKHGSASHTSSGVTPLDYGGYSTLRIAADGTVTLASLAWNAAFTYAANQPCLGSNSKFYIAVISSTGVDPTTDDGTHWKARKIPREGSADGQVPIWDNTAKDYIPGVVSGGGGGMPTGSDGQFPINDGSTPWIAVTASGDVTLVDTGAFTVVGIQGVKAGLISWSVTAGKVPVFNGTSLESVAIGGDATLNGSGTVVVTGIQSNAVKSGIPTNAQAYIWNNANSRFELVSFSGDFTITAAGVATLKNVGTAATYGDATHVPQLTTDAQGRVTAVSAVLITGTLPGGSAGGDLSGTYPNPTVAKINGALLGTIAVTSGRLIVGDGSALQSVAMSGDATIAANGALTLGTVNSNVGAAGDASHTLALTVNAKGLVTAVTSNAIAIAASQVTSGLLDKARGGTGVDLSGTGGATSFVTQDASHNITVRTITASDISGLAGTVPNGATTGDGLYWTGSAWAPSSILVNNNSTIVINPAAANVGLTINGASGSTAAKVVATSSLALELSSTIAATLRVYSSVAGAGVMQLGYSGATPSNGQAVGSYTFGGFVGSTWQGSAGIIGLGTETWVDGSANGTSLLFRTVPTGGNSTRNSVRFQADGDVWLNSTGSALATNATKGFTHLPNCAGTPTGTPANTVTGVSPLIVDSTGKRLMVYVSGWQDTSIGVPVTVTASSNIFTPDASTSKHFRLTLAATNTIAAPTNPTDGQKIILEIIQDGTGSRTVTWNAVFLFGTDVPQPTLTTTASKRDFVGFVYNSTLTKWVCLAVSRGY